MDRRRYIPSPEGLEGRAMLSLFGGGNSVQAVAPAQVPVTFHQKEQRIEHLPYYLKQLQPDRFLPEATIQNLQEDLLSIAGRLHKPGPAKLEAFNETLRDVGSNASLSVGDAKRLSYHFQAVLGDTGATVSQVASLTQDMNELAKVDALSPESVYLATNDYSLVLQTILGVGRPIQRPPAPQISLQEGVRESLAFGKTTIRQPVLVGSYGAGSSVGANAGGAEGGFNSSGVLIKIVDQDGTVYGQSFVDPNNGNYRVKIGVPLSNGVHRFRALAIDAEGHESPPSRDYFLTVVSRPGETVVTGQSTPQGPGGRF